MSFDNLRDWHKQLLEITEDAPVFLVANKSDLAEHEVVDFKHAADFAREIGTKIYSTSAKDGTGI